MRPHRLKREAHNAPAAPAEPGKAALRRSVFPAVLLTDCEAAAAGTGAVMFLYRAAYHAGAEAAEPVIA